MGAKGKRKCPKCGQWTPWTECPPDGTCAECQAKGFGVGVLVVKNDEGTIIQVLK